MTKTSFKKPFSNLNVLGKIWKSLLCQLCFFSKLVFKTCLLPGSAKIFFFILPKMFSCFQLPWVSISWRWSRMFTCRTPLMKKNAQLLFETWTWDLWFQSPRWCHLSYHHLTEIVLNFPKRADLREKLIRVQLINLRPAASIASQNWNRHFFVIKQQRFD